MIIGINAKARRGKDLLASHLAKALDSHVIHFADALYDECRHPHEVLYVQEPQRTYAVIDSITYTTPILLMRIKKWFEMSRPKNMKVLEQDGTLIYSISTVLMDRKDPLLLQWWGTEYKRNHFFNNYWVDEVDYYIREHWPEKNTRRVIIADVRFRNEAEYIRQHDDGILVRIEAPYPIENTGRDDNHPSETEMDDYDQFDVTVYNDFSNNFIPIAMSLITTQCHAKGLL